MADAVTLRDHQHGGTPVQLVPRGSVLWAMPTRPLSVMLFIILAGCQPAASPSVGDGVLEIRAVAGPVCPVEREPPDPACDPRPVDGARIFVSPGDGRDIVVAEARTDAEGLARIELPAGDYIVTALEVPGLFGYPEPVTITIEAALTEALVLTWDTGIR